MKKTILKRILALVIVFMMFISTPFSVFGNLYNNHIYVYASTFASDIESEMFKQLLIPTLISAGLVFSTKDSIDQTVYNVKDWLYDQGFDWRDPEEPDGPTLGELVKTALSVGIVWNAGKQLYNNVIEIPNELWKLIKSFVDENYEIGPNIQTDNYINNPSGGDYVFGTVPLGTYHYRTKYGYMVFTVSEYDYSPYPYNVKFELTVYSAEGINEYDKAMEIKPIQPYTLRMRMTSTDFKAIYAGKAIGPSFTTPIDEYNYLPEFEDTIYGVEDIVDNPNYDWNNNKTGTKTIPIPIETDVNGNLKVDENGYYLPTIDVEEWVQVTPEEIPFLDPTGVPTKDIPLMPEKPDGEEPDWTTGILIWIGNLLQLIVGSLSSIVESIKTIVTNTNTMIFGTPEPVFDPTTGQQIDPETGEPIEPEIEPEAGGGIIGDGIDTNIPTDFEWGDFKHFLDIFFIFIYFIVILILILLKFLEVAFTGLIVSPNTVLFSDYPEILAGVNYIKNLKVGGMTITVQQAFEFIFMVFFYIFVIKQIRKLYNAAVYEESKINRRETKDMKMDYYEQNRHYNPQSNHVYKATNMSRNSSEYKNLKITDYTED